MFRRPKDKKQGPKPPKPSKSPPLPPSEQKPAPEKNPFDHPLPDAKELEKVPTDELDALGIFYEVMKISDSVIDAAVLNGRRLFNHFLADPKKAEVFNKALTMTKHTIKGTGTITKFIHSWDPSRRRINKSITKLVHRRWGPATPEVVDEFHRIYGLWNTFFAKEYFGQWSKSQIRGYFGDENFVQQAAVESINWLQEQFKVDQEAATVMCFKFLSLFAEDIDADMPFYELFDPGLVPRAPPSPEAKKREAIVKDLALDKQYDAYFVRPKKKKKKRR